MAEQSEGGVTRLSFIKAGATGMAVVGIPAATVLTQNKQGQVTEPTSENPREPVMAYVRDAQRGEVTVMSGTRETTYRDPALVKRLLTAAPQEGIDVIAP